MILRPDMLEHADGNDVIETAGLVDVAIVLNADLDRKIAAESARVVCLSLRNGHADDGRAISLARKFLDPAPAAADVQHALTRFESDLSADQTELGDLRLIQRLRLAPIAAGVKQQR